MSAPALLGRDGRRYPLAEDAPRWRGEDGSPLMMSELPVIGPADIDPSLPGQWRYAATLPVPLAPLALGEGRTPLLPGELGGAELLIKPEYQNPTGSFKDRGAAVMVAWLAARGVPALLEDSSGNGGAAIAAYAAAAGVEATILAPEATSAAKTVQARVHGARVELVPGDRQATADEAVRRSAGICYASHNWQPFFLQGTKLLAYEIWEDLGFRAPDAVLVPLGAGSLVLGCAIGFGELVRAGAIERLPRILASQPANCSPLARAFAAGADEAGPGEWAPTIAEGTAIAHPVRDREVLAAVRESGGRIVAVAEEEIVAGVRELSARGWYVEPTSASVAAAVPQYLAAGDLRAGDEAVAVLSGSGLKAGPVLERLL